MNAKVSNLHLSTTHEERYYHVNDGGFRGTVFLRKESGGWCGSASCCHANDNFSRKIGRNVSRRRYFQAKQGCDQPRVAVQDGSKESALLVGQLVSMRIK